jgi:hypothetical protein
MRHDLEKDLNLAKLVTYAYRVLPDGLSPIVREDGSFFIVSTKSKRNKDVYSVIKDGVWGYETWDYKTGYSTRYRYPESVKRSLRRIAASAKASSTASSKEARS